MEQKIFSGYDSTRIFYVAVSGEGCPRSEEISSIE